MRTVGLVGVGHMGSGLGWALREGGHRVVTTLAGRSPRSAGFARATGIEVLPDLESVLSTVDVLLVVTPPGEALPAAEAIAALRRPDGPLVADLNAVAPSTMDRIGVILGDVVDGAISGAPPTVRPGARVFLSGPRADEVAELRWRHVQPILVGDRIGQASAVKMSTASVYKGLVAILTQATRAGAHYGVLDHVLEDLARAGHEPGRDIAVAATKAWRYVPEMLQIAASQRNAGLPGELFEAFATVYAELAHTELAQEEPESVDTAAPVASLIQRLRPPA